MSRLAPLTLLSTLFALGLAACAHVPPPLPPPAAPLDVARVQALLAYRLDTLNVRETDADRFFNPTRWQEDVRRMEMIRGIEREDSEEFIRLAHLTKVESRDSLLGAYRAGVNDAIRGLKRGTFHLQEWNSHRSLAYSLRSGHCLRDEDLWHGVLWRDFRTVVGYPPTDRYVFFYGGQSAIAYGEGYNRIAIPVIESYWDIQGLRSTVYSRMHLYATSENPDVRSQWITEC